MGNIVLLDDLTINKIAAGEVIERPASAVKELVENSIDAGATKIDVEIKNGGISYIRVTDNGKGIMKDDMEIAFERHATSKIREAKDLETVKSMGFRGEALASIAAIAKVTMQSKTQESDVGNQIVVEGGKVLSQEEGGYPQGTSITIENLFYNTPVRYKFLRKDFTEAGYIEDAITRIALIHPEIAIKLISMGKTVIQTSGNNDIKSVIYGIYGKDIAENILNVNYEYEDIKITGVIGKPEVSRGNRSNQLFFVNNRYVKDKILTSACEQAFKGIVESGKFAFLVLNIELEPQKVDVNVHPAKLEVRFEEEQKVFRAVYHAIKDTLLKNKLIDEQEATKDAKLEATKPSYEYFIKSSVTQKETENSEGKEEKGFFKKLLSISKNEEEEKSNIIEQLYESRKQNEESTTNYENNINPIPEKMEAVQKTEEEFEQKDSEQKDSEQKDNEQKDSERKDNEQKDNEQERKEQQIQNVEETQIISNDEIQREIQKQDEYISKMQKTFTDETNKHEEDISNLEKQEEINVEESIEEEIQEEKENNQENKIDEQEKAEQIEEIEQEKANFIAEIYEQKQEAKAEPKAEPKEFEEMYTSIFGKSPMSYQSEVKEKPETYKIPEAEGILTNENISLFGNETDRNIPKYRFVGIAFNSYIIIEIEKELYIIDERAARQKIVYKNLRKSYCEENDKDSQLMLLPDIINLSYKEMNIAKDNMDMFEKAGFMLEEFGNNTIKLYGVPSICMDLDTKELFIEILKEINKVARTETEEVEKKFISTIAKNVVQNTKPLSTKEEIDQLIEELFAMPDSLKSSEGIPICMKMTRFDIEKKFSRR